MNFRFGLVRYQNRIPCPKELPIRTLPIKIDTCPKESPIRTRSLSKSDNLSERASHSDSFPIKIGYPVRKSLPFGLVPY